MQSLDAQEISAWYGKSEGLTAEEISFLASQKTCEGCELLAVMQHGMPIAKSAENLSANSVQHASVKNAEDVKLPEEATPVVLDIQKKFPLVNAKGACVKKQNVPLYKAVK